MDSAGPKDGSYQEPQISPTMVRKLRWTSDDLWVCVNGGG